MGSRLTRVALRTSLIYGTVAILWILFSDRVLVALVPDSGLVYRLQTYKGVVFVVITAILLYVLLRGQLRRWEDEAAARRQAEQAFSSSESRLQIALKSGHMGTWGWDIASGQVWWDEAAAKLFGRSLHELPEGGVDKFISLVHPEDRGRVETLLKQAVQDGGDYYGEFRIVRPDGTILWVADRATVERDAAGRARRMTGACVDISVRKQAEDELRQVNSSLHALSDCNQALVRITDEEELLKTVCRIVVDVGGYRLAWVGYAEDDEAKSVRPMAQAGYEMGYLETLNLTWADTERGRGPTGKAIRSGQPCSARDTLNDPEFAPWREEALRRGYASSLSLPLISGERTFGAFNIYSTRPDAFGSAETALLLELANDLAFGISALRTKDAMQLFRRLIDRTNDLVFVLDAATGRPVDVNEAVCRHLGFSRDELLGMNVTSLTEDSFDWDEHAREVKVAGSLVVERRLRRKDGHLFPVELGITHVEQEYRPYLIAVARDISERKQAEEALQESERRLRTVVQNAPAIIFILDREGIFRLSEGQALAKLGLAPGEVVGKSALEIYRDVPAVVESIQQALSGQLTRTVVELPGVVFDTVFSPVLDRAGLPAGLIGIAIDITERRQAEQRLHDVMSVQKAILDNAAYAIISTSPDGIIQTLNPAAERMLGYPAHELVGKARFDMLCDPLELAEHARSLSGELGVFLEPGFEVIVARARHNQTNEVEWTHVRKDRTRFPASLSVTALRDSNGMITGFLGIARNITEQRRLAEQLRQSQKMEAIGTLAGGVAHDFNNILTVIQGYAALLLSGGLTAGESADSALQIARAAERAAALTQQLLIFGRKQAMEPSDIDLNEVVAGLTKMLRRIVGEDISLQSDYASNLPWIHGDAGMLEQVLLNLAINSRDAMPEGGRLIISTGTETITEKQAQQNPESLPGACVYLSVSDSGTGIPPEHLPHVFEPFYTTKEAGKGTGLGLATAYSIVKQHRGWTTVTSEVNKGTTFRIYFPAVTTKRRDKSAAAPSPALPRGHETILLVEDEPALRLLVGNILERCGYTVLQADSGHAALNLWRKHREKVQLLFTDMVMPDGITGRELARRLAAEKPGLKVIYTSGYSADLTSKGLALVDGLNYLRKPFNPQRLAQTVRSRLDQS